MEHEVKPNEKTYGGAYRGIAITIWILGTFGSFILGDSLREVNHYDYNFTVFFAGLVSTVITGALFYAIGQALNYLGQCRDALQKATGDEAPQQTADATTEPETVDAM